MIGSVSIPENPSTFKNDLRALSFGQLALLNECHVAKVRPCSAPLALLGARTMLNDIGIVAFAYHYVDVRQHIMYGVSQLCRGKLIKNSCELLIQYTFVCDGASAVNFPTQP